MAEWFPDPVEIGLDDALDMIRRLDEVVDALEEIGETHLAFAVHNEVRLLLDHVIPDDPGS